MLILYFYYYSLICKFSRQIKSFKCSTDRSEVGGAQLENGDVTTYVDQSELDNVNQHLLTLWFIKPQNADDAEQ